MPEVVMTSRAPLSRGDDGTIRITGSRVTLESIITQFKNGATAEQIQEDFPSLSLSDIYGAISYYLQNTPSVEDYLRAQNEASLQSRREIEGKQDISDLRQRLRERRSKG